MKFTPVYDKGYYPMIVKLNDFKKAVAKEESKLLKICVERNKGYNFIYNLDIFADDSKREENYGVAERLIKTILWVACQEMTADLVGNNFVIDAGGESEKKVLLKEENLKTLTDLILEFGSFNVVVKGEQTSNVQEENVTEKVNKFFGEENVEIKN